MSASSDHTPLPQLVGYSGAWDHQAREWVFTRDGDPSRVLRGRNQAELEEARWALVFRMCDELRQICAYAARNGMTPPPPTWQPEPYTHRTSRRRSPPSAT